MCREEAASLSSEPSPLTTKQNETERPRLVVATLRLTTTKLAFEEFALKRVGKRIHEIHESKRQNGSEIRNELTNEWTNERIIVRIGTRNRNSEITYSFNLVLSRDFFVQLVVVFWHENPETQNSFDRPKKKQSLTAISSKRPAAAVAIEDVITVGVAVATLVEF